MPSKSLMQVFPFLGSLHDVCGDPLTRTELAWLAVGTLGQALFFARFLVQWFASERRRRSVIPIAFWYLSLGGGLVLLCYAIHRSDPVFILGQALGSLIYLRNLQLAYRGAGQETAPRHIENL